MLYFASEISSSDAVDHRKNFDREDLNVIVEVLEGQITPRSNVCTPEFEELASSLIRESNLNLPKNVLVEKIFFSRIVELIDVL